MAAERQNQSTATKPEKRMRTRISRRAFLDGTLGLAGAAAGVIIQPAQAFATPDSTTGSALDPVLFPMHRSINAISNDAVVETDLGSVKGYIGRGIYIFKGIPYGEDTSGANRFTLAKKPKPWTGMRSCMSFGKACPQAPRTDGDESTWMFEWDDSVTGEDCLHLNVWTPAINDNKKRAVMVWIHGGVYATGSSQQIPCNDGENLSRRGDVVVVSLNHRINLLGFMNFEKYGEQFRHSANISQLDIVAALEWVKVNIANFGGNPNLVTIFGQSGGGGKVTYLLAMPCAQGLFHRAIIESGSNPHNFPASHSEKLTDYILEDLQIAASRIAEVQSIPYDKLKAATDLAALRLRREMPPSWPGGLRQSGSDLQWEPVVDGSGIPSPAYYPSAPETAKNVPVMIGSTLNEFVNGVDHPEYESLTWDELRERVEKALPGTGDEAIRIYRHNSPKASPFDIWSQMNATTAMRRNAVEIAKRQSAQGTAFNYQFRWKTPVLDGRPRAFHGLDMPFVFDNTDHPPTMTGGGDDARALSAKVSDAWIAFAKTGNPSHPGLPKWEAVKGDRVPVMWLDNECELKVNPDDDELRITA